MKTTNYLFILLIASLLAISCNKSNDPAPDKTIKSVSDLVVPADFDWKTTQTLDVTVKLPADGDIQPLIITNRDGSKRYFRGYPEDGSRTIRTKVTIPTYLNELKLTYSGATGPNMVFVSNGELYYDFNLSARSTETVGCDLSGFITYSKGGWGSVANGNNVGTLRDLHFDDVYPVNFIVGDPAHYTITFNASINVQDYLPGGGGPAVLSQSWTNPAEGLHLGNMADQIIAARLNRDFNAAGYLGTNPDYELGDLVFIDGPFANMSVNDFLAMAEIALGGGGLNGHTASEYATAAENIILSFHEGVSGNTLTCPENPDEEDPYIELSSVCSQPDVIFTISNTGDGGMTTAKAYTLYKNNVQISSGTYQLAVNQTLNITATGTSEDTFKLTAENPAGGLLEEIITGCGGDDDGDQLAGTLAYEDLWPGKGDYDFNDLIIDYNFAVNKNSAEVVQSITATFVIKAFGASYHNGFGFTLPTVLPSDIASVSGTNVENSTVFSIAGNGVENGQSKATIIVYDDARRVMPQTTGGIGVNTQLEYAYTEPVTMVVTINFVDNAITYSELNIGSFNPFIIVNSTLNGAPGARGLEVHLPNYEPSDLFDDTYFGQFDDNSSVADGRYFVTANNHPWAINIAEGFDWVIEFQDITGAYHMFAEWAQSGGTNYADWYLNNTGYRNTSLIYPTQIGN
ncbi:MAG: LruC domain-containing protein [Bacteroidales bacterium]|nr:LruC domain-containing protein [Bacteroidales bacterium]